MFLCRSWYFGITQTPTVLDDCRGFPSDFSQKTTFQTILTESECLYRSISGTYTSKNGWKCPYGSIQWTCTSTQGDNRPWHCPNPESKHLERSDGAIRRPAGPGIWRQRRQIRKGEQAAGVYEGAEPPVLRYVIVNNYRTNFDDFREVYLFGSQVDRWLPKEAGH